MVDALSQIEQWITANLMRKMVFVSTAIRNIILNKMDNANKLLFQIV